MPDAQPPGEPWRRSWLWCAPGERPTLAWIVLLHVLGIAAVTLLPLPSAAALAIAFALLFVGGLGTTIAYHRALAHRAVSLHPLVEQPLLLFAVLNGSGDPANWVRMHRLHHATADRADDISSPHAGGFWWAHLRWLWQADTARAATMARDLAQGRYAFWSRAIAPLLVLSLLGGLLWPSDGIVDALAAAAWIGPLRLLYALHVQCTVNSVCHLGAVGSPHGSGRDVWWLACAHMGHGENWHGRHHRSPGDPRIGGRWWQVDIGWWVIRGLVACRLAELPRRVAARAGDGATAAR